MMDVEGMVGGVDEGMVLVGDVWSRVDAFRDGDGIVCGVEKEDAKDEVRGGDEGLWVWDVRVE